MFTCKLNDKILQNYTGLETAINTAHTHTHTHTPLDKNILPLFINILDGMGARIRKLTHALLVSAEMTIEDGGWQLASSGTTVQNVSNDEDGLDPNRDRQPFHSALLGKHADRNAFTRQHI